MASIPSVALREQSREGPNQTQQTVAVVGLGYVGLPLAIEFGKRYSTVGYDLSEDKVRHNRSLRDPTNQVTREEF